MDGCMWRYLVSPSSADHAKMRQLFSSSSSCMAAAARGDGMGVDFARH